ncbi:MAG: bifunctional folylpolyglutamate synthase/dihydrofolate synthase [Acidobacteria bacterium]|nr:bifunctional folylpolyglutamate synthase/dihydrofolate synthase [Acidobacteriota bacterium]
MTPVERLFALEQFGIKLGLDAMRVLLAALGNPHLAWPSLHIAGTNGKGSVSAMTERALRAAGLATGRYTSPHLFRVEERIALDGRDIETPRLSGALARVFTAVDRLVAQGALAAVPTYFEVSTAAAFLIFAEAGVDVAVVEVGLGGRYDATNVLTPVAGAITSIDFDHERHLGTTLAAIAGEKAGIAKRGVPLVVGEVGDEAWRAIAESARLAGAPVIRVQDGTQVETALVDGHARLTVTTPAGRYGPVRLALGGTHQAANALVAIRLLETFAAETRRPLDTAHVETGLALVQWPARLEWLRDPRTGARVLIDAAHNPAGARALASYLSLARVPPVTLVTSVMADKDVPGVLGPLLPHAARVVVTEAATRRAMPADALAAAVTALAAPGTPVDVVREPGAAVTFAHTLAAPVVLAGSIYLIGPLRASLVAGGFEPA